MKTIRHTLFFLIILVFSTTLTAQQPWSYALKAGVAGAVGKDQFATDQVDTCYTVTRSSVASYDRLNWHFLGTVKYRFSSRFSVGLTSGVQVIPEEEFNYFITPVYQDVIQVPLRLQVEAVFLRFRWLDVALAGEFGYLFKKVELARDLVEESGGLNFAADLAVYPTQKLKGFFLKAGYEWQRDEVLFDVNRIFQLGKVNCPVYRYRLSRHWAGVKVGFWF